MPITDVWKTDFLKTPVFEKYVSPSQIWGAPTKEDIIEF